MQRFARQKTEDGPDTSAKWGKDLVFTDTEDPNNEDYLPIPNVGPGPASGKTCASESLRDWSDDDDDYQILEVLDPRSIAFSYSVSLTSAD